MCTSKFATKRKIKCQAETGKRAPVGGNEGTKNNLGVIKDGLKSFSATEVEFPEQKRTKKPVLLMLTVDKKYRFMFEDSATYTYAITENC